MGLDDLYRNTIVMDIFPGSPVGNASKKRGATIDTATVGINEALLAIVVRGSTFQSYAAGAALGANKQGTLTIRFLQSPSTNASSWTHIPGSTIVRRAKNTIAATPIYATQRYIAGTYGAVIGAGTHILFSVALVGTGRVLPLSVTK